MTVTLTEQEKLAELKMARPLLRSMVDRFMKSGLLEREDAMQEAKMGFLEGLARYDVCKGTSVRTYARAWVINRLQEACNRNLLVHVPLGLGKVVLSDYHSAQAGSPPSTRKVEPTERTKEVAGRAMTFSRFAERIDTPTCRATPAERVSQQTLEQEIAMCTATNDPGDLVDQHVLQEHLQTLRKKQQQIVYLRFYCEMTLEEAGHYLGISREAARQIQERGLIALRERMAANDTPAVIQHDSPKMAMGER